jgi:predicted alpha/beta superfamily hydrolase
MKGQHLRIAIAAGVMPGYALLATVLWLACASGAGAQQAPAVERAAGAAGDLRVHELTSRVFGNRRALRVLVPPGYDAPENRDRRYPVLYLNDGQNLFDRVMSTFNSMEWEVDETVARLMAAGQLPALIVVGIDHAGRRGRAREYLPYPDAYLDPPEPHPAGRRYPAFVVDEVVPFIESHYRTAPGAEHRALGGSSYGALAALFTAATRPGIFGRLLLESPSLYVADGRIFRDLARARRLPARVYLGVGTNELGAAACTAADAGGEAVADVHRLAAALRERGGAVEVRVAVESCARHDEAAWARRLPDALRFLYAR